MPADPKTTAALNSPACGLIPVKRSSPLRLLERLSRYLFNLDPPAADTYPALIAGDTMEVDTVFGPVGSDDVTPQYEIARVTMRETDYLVQGIETAVALQLGLGSMRVVNNAVIGDCPRAEGSDLDRVGAQYGIGRPVGFTDACYWRLLTLLLWTPGPTTWLLAEVATLYTGIRPQFIEAPGLLTLRWPLNVAGTFFNYDGFFNVTGFYAGATSSPSQADGCWRSGNPSIADSYWMSGGSSRGAGMTLANALDFVKPAGTAIRLDNAPRNGQGGCSGATQRVPFAYRGQWTQGTEEGV